MSVFRKELGMSRLLSVLILMLAVSANADEQGQLNVKTVVQKEEVVINDDGERETRLVAADAVVPGERVVYTITFRNIGEEPAENVVITNPIADSLTFVDGSAFGPGMDIEYSIDGGVTYAAASDLVVSEAGVDRPAGPKDFTHVRWVMQTELAAGAQGIARFAAVLD